MRAGLWIAVGALFLQACRCPCPPGVAVPPAFDLVRTGWTRGVEWAIFDSTEGPRFVHPADAYWRPTASEVQAALVRIDGHLVGQLEVELPEEKGDTDDWHAMIRGVREKLRMYRCQVVGVVQGERRLLYLNFFHSLSFEPLPGEAPDDWTREPHFVDDGGDWYWQIYYDPERVAFERLSVNGEA